MIKKICTQLLNTKFLSVNEHEFEKDCWYWNKTKETERETDRRKERMKEG